MDRITQLSLFHKNTDATSTERGYEFQKLKTIEAWLQNKLSGNQEVIYYDYQDDVFQRDFNELKSTFRQLKLYSSNFSFSSTEIKKAITHFFTLYCLEEYRLDSVEFVFEANSNIAKPYKGNDAKLLKDWFENQESLEGEILDNCTQKVKEITRDYVDTINTEDSQILKAKEVFESLIEDDEFWRNFTKTIRWRFEGIEPEEALANSIRNISTLIPKLSYPFEKHHVQSLLNSLHFYVSQAATKENPQDRLLSNDLLEKIIFKVLGGENEEYGNAIDKYNINYEVEHFILGKVYEIISWSRYYRQHDNLDGHKEIWTKVLEVYLSHPDTPKFCKKDILYEIIFLKLQPTSNFDFKNPDSNNISSLSQSFFELVPNRFSDTAIIEDATNLYSILRTANQFEVIKLDKNILDNWLANLEACLLDKIKVEKPNEKCSYLESYSFFLLALKYPDSNEKEKVLKEFICIIQQIMDLNTDAPFYNYSNLYERINGMIKGLIQFDHSQEKDDIIDELEKLSERLAPIVEAREGKFALAKRYRDKGIEYLKFSSRKRDLLKSLDSFQKAKSLLFLEETKEDFILALLNISQVYNAIGFNIAAKYYALAGFYMAIGEEKYLEKTAKSIALIHHYDFNQGAWISCMMDIEQFLNVNGQFIGNWDINQNTALRKVLLDYAFVLYATPRLSLQTKGLISQQLISLGELKESHLDGFLSDLGNVLDSKEKFERSTKGNTIDYPLNDLGEKRKIQFNAFGYLWNIEFDNDYDSNVLGEEFCAIFQVLLAELSINFKNFGLKKEIGVVHFILEEGNQLVPPEEIEDLNGNVTWKITLPKITKPAPYYPSILSILMTVFKKLVSEGIDMVELLFLLNKDHELGSKATIVQPYDKLYKEIFPKENYDSLMRESFDKVILEGDYIKKNDII